MFARMADIYENETRSAIRRFTSLFEPLVILVMGIVVGALVLSMLLAITGINDVVHVDRCSYAKYEEEPPVKPA